MKTHIEIRPLNNDHCKAVQRLVLHIQQVEFKLPLGLEDQKDMLDIESNYQGRGGGFWGAFQKDELVGTIALVSGGEGTGTLRKMFVKEEYRGKQKDVAGKLLQELLQFCAGRGIDKLYLGTIDVLKAAHRFYEKNGFRRISRARLPPEFQLAPHDNVYYYISLKNREIRNVIDEAGVLAISTRLQRLSDLIRKDGQQVYKAHGIDFEPKWFPVIYALHKKGVLSVGAIAGQIGYTHPSTISLLKELEKRKLVGSKKDKTDERRRLIYLTACGSALVKEAEPVWRLLAAGITDLIDTGNNLMSAINEVEKRLDKKSVLQRAQDLSGS